MTPASAAYRPDLILRYEWIPDVPEVNAPGDDDRDDGSNPWGAIMARWREIQSGTYAHDVKDYALRGAGAGATVPVRAQGDER